MRVPWGEGSGGRGLGGRGWCQGVPAAGGTGGSRTAPTVGWGSWECDEGWWWGCPAAPPLWIPAFAGMTVWGVGQFEQLPLIHLGSGSLEGKR